MKGKPLALTGKEVKVGDDAPDFVAISNDFKVVKLSDLRNGKVCIVASVPSLDTPVCSVETRRFNLEAAGLSGVCIVTVSMDLPFAQKRWCAAEGVLGVTTVSDFRDRSFGNSYGMLIGELGLLARAVFVVDTTGKIVYEQVVPEITAEPDYEAVLKAAKHAAGH